MLRSRDGTSCYLDERLWVEEALHAGGLLVERAAADALAARAEQPREVGAGPLDGSSSVRLASEARGRRSPRWRRTRRSARRPRAGRRTAAAARARAPASAARCRRSRAISTGLPASDSSVEHVEERLEQPAVGRVEDRRDGDEAVGAGDRVERLRELGRREAGEQVVGERRAAERRAARRPRRRPSTPAAAQVVDRRRRPAGRPAAGSTTARAARR